MSAISSFRPPVLSDTSTVDTTALRLSAPQVTTKLQGKAGDIVSRVAALTLDAIDGPMQQLINGLVDDLESSATAAAFREIRQKMVEYKLISAEAVAA